MTEPIPRPSFPSLPKPAPIKLNQVSWISASVEGREVLALTADEYIDLSKNQAEILRWINEADDQLDYYRENLK